MNLYLLVVALVVWVAAAAAAPPTQAVALALAGVVAIFSPLLLKYVPWTGAQMTALTMLIALAVAVLASWLTGDLVLSREGIVAALLNSTAIWTVQQIVYAALKQVAPTAVGAAPKATSPIPTTTPATPART